MSTIASAWTITFDVSANTGRRAVNRLLAEYGQRVLYTVYEIAVTGAELDQMIAAAQIHLQPGDHLLAMRRCPRCRTAHGAAPPRSRNR